MNRYAVLVLTASSMFLVIMAILVDSPPLFFMSAALIATLLASRLQAYLAVRGLRFERFSPEAVRVGEEVTMEIVVWSQRKLKRPLVNVVDHLPKQLVTKDRKHSLPVAPSFDQPIRTRYSFKPMRRGRFRWSHLTVHGTDALGLITQQNDYQTEPVNLTVYPAPIPVSVDLQPSPGWGVSDLETATIKGPGIEPRGIREYAEGDPERYVHWASSARAGKLMVKEFDTGSGVSLCFVLQNSQGSEVGDEDASTLEAMCGHLLYLSNDFLSAGAMVQFPQFEDRHAPTDHSEARIREIRDLLTEVEADGTRSLTQVLEDKRAETDGTTLVVAMAEQDADLPGYLASHPRTQRTVLIYDAREYAKDRRLPDGYRAAAEPGYLSELEAAGAHVILMPTVEKIG
ncbi:MAG: DUF58 domain-containing protein [Fimbriimonadaceae bacterium]